MATRAIAVAAGTADIQALVPGDALRLMGFSVAESASSAAAAEVVLRHGESSSAPLLTAPINLDANGIGFPRLPSNGIECQSGIFVDRVSGNTSLVLYVDG